MKKLVRIGADPEFLFTQGARAVGASDAGLPDNTSAPASIRLPLARR